MSATLQRDRAEKPQAQHATGGEGPYRWTVSQLSEADEIAPLLAPGRRLRVADLLGLKLA